MTTSTNLSGRNLPPRPPTKGSFPLDHLGECGEFARVYEACVRDNGGEAGRCREAARKYLGCRMEADLMVKEDFKKLGLGAEQDRTGSRKEHDSRADVRDGFVSGMKLAQQRKNNKKSSPGTPGHPGTPGESDAGGT